MLNYQTKTKPFFRWVDTVGVDTSGPFTNPSLHIDLIIVSSPTAERKQKTINSMPGTTSLL